MAGPALLSYLVFSLGMYFPVALDLYDAVPSSGSASINPIDQCIAEDSLVNYCKLVSAGFFYGQKLADKKMGLSAEDVDSFNDQWKEVFNIPFYQTGITNREFVMHARLGEGNRIAFPPSSLYHEAHTDTYFLFHIAKEIGMIHSVYFSKCPSCVDLSIAKINAYLNVTSIRSRIPQIWSADDMYKKLMTISEVDAFRAYLNCVYTDQQINPKYYDPFASERKIRCPDTVQMTSLAELRPQALLSWPDCDETVTIDTIGPLLITGIDGEHGATYRVTFVVHSNCVSSDTCSQYFVIK